MVDDGDQEDDDANAAQIKLETIMLEKSLTRMTELIHELQSLRIRMKDNKRVLESLKTFYDNLFKEFEALNIKSSLPLDWSAKIRDELNGLLLQLKPIHEQTDEIMQRVLLLEELGRGYEKLVSLTSLPLSVREYLPYESTRD
jgi:phosphoglycerate-specific signal transduction histidine kinase